MTISSVFCTLAKSGFIRTIKHNAFPMLLVIIVVVIIAVWVKVIVVLVIIVIFGL